MQFTIFTANCVGKKSNCSYPKQVTVTDEAGLRAAVAYDHVCARYQGNYKEAFHIKWEADLLNIIPVQLCFVRYLQFIPTVDLCPACQARLHIIGIILIPLSHQHILIPECRSRSDNRHVPDEYIPNLRQFVDAGSSHKAAHFGYILIRIVQHMCRHIMRRRHLHGSELPRLNLGITPIGSLALYSCNNILGFSP